MLRSDNFLTKINFILAKIDLKDYKKVYAPAAKKREKRKIVIKYLDFIFGGPAGKGKERLYFPLNISSTKAFKELENQINEFISEYGYSVESLEKGTVKKEGNKNIFRLGKILNDLIKKDPKAAELLKAFNESKSSKEAADADTLIVISRHPYDIAGMSTGRDWADGSCMSLEYGRRHHDAKQWKTVPHSIELGAFVAFLIKANDKNINNPMSRIVIKPYYNEDKSYIYYYPDQTIYGKHDPNFMKFVNEWVEEKNILAAEEFNAKLIDIYKLPKNIYEQNPSSNYVKMMMTEKNKDSLTDIDDTIEKLSKVNFSDAEEAMNKIKEHNQKLAEKIYDRIVELILES